MIASGRTSGGRSLHITAGAAPCSILLTVVKSAETTREKHRRAAAERRHQLYYATAGILACSACSSAQGGGAPSLWRHSCVWRPPQQIRVRRRNMRRLSWLRGLLDGAVDVLDGAVAYSGRQSRWTYRMRVLCVSRTSNVCTVLWYGIELRNELR